MGFHPLPANQQVESCAPTGRFGNLAGKNMELFFVNLGVLFVKFEPERNSSLGPKPGVQSLNFFAFVWSNSVLMPKIFDCVKIDKVQR